MTKVLVLIVSFFTCFSVFSNNLYEYNLLESQFGYNLYEKDGIYVQRINLKNVDLRFVHGSQNGNEFQSGKLTNWWSGISQLFPEKLVSINNLSFFENGGNITALSFPYKSLGTIRTMGASDGYLNGRKMFAIKNSCYDEKPCPLITDYDSSTLNSNLFDNLIVGLDPFDDDVTHWKRGKNTGIQLGRTYAGVSYDLPSMPILYVVIAEKATNDTMTGILSNLGVLNDNMIMFDGSGSSQLKTQTTSVYGLHPTLSGYIADKRPIPQVMVITSK